MSGLIKYRVHEVAKDFNMTSKEITQILTDYATTPKNHMQVLEDAELNDIFEYLTQHHQAASLEELYKVPDQPKAKPQAASAEAPKSGTAQQPAAQTQQAAQPQQQPKPKKDDKPHQPRQVAERRVVDTRGATTNLSKYDQRLDDLVPERAQNKRGGKQKIQNRNRQRPQNPAAGAKRRQEERDKMQKLQLEIAKKQQLKVQIPDTISVGELASRMKKTGAEVVRRLVKMGVMASLSDTIDYDTAALVAMELGCKVEHEVIVTVEERLIDDREDSEDELVPRAPVVVVMGHVDHGKTSLLDRIRRANVAAGEAGGITQHIGAYRVMVNGKPVTFLDTPGHEAFTSMRARGAMVTDIAILVVAADDGIMPQTIESINHAKAAGTPIVVAINKMDLPGANPDRIKQDLTKYDLVPEEWGGDTIVCPISAKTGAGVKELLENLVLQAEIMELKANPNRPARGTVVEARLDKGRGPIMTVLVQNGTLHTGDIIIAGTAVGRVRVMTNDKGLQVKDAGPSIPDEITGLTEVPAPGDEFNAVADERMGLSDEEMVRALYIAGAIGQAVATKASIAGAAGGCQYEIGTASAMAAAALCYLGGGDAEAICHAAALAIKSLLGLVCDPIAGLVEVPCIKRNASGAMVATARKRLMFRYSVVACPPRSSAARSISTTPVR